MDKQLEQILREFTRGNYRTREVPRGFVLILVCVTALDNCCLRLVLYGQYFIL